MVLVWEGPGSLAGVEGPRAARGGHSWSPAAIGESDVNLRTRSRTEPARWNGEGPLARGVGSRRDGAGRQWLAGTGTAQSPGWGKQASTLVLGWLAGAEHRQGELAGARVSQVWQHGEAVAAKLRRGRERRVDSGDHLLESSLPHPSSLPAHPATPTAPGFPTQLRPSLSHRPLLPLTPG